MPHRRLFAYVGDLSTDKEVVRVLLIFCATLLNLGMLVPIFAPTPLAVGSN